MDIKTLKIDDIVYHRSVYEHKEPLNFSKRIIIKVGKVGHGSTYSWKDRHLFFENKNNYLK